MTFRIEWLQTATNELAAAWTKADSVLRAAITSAAHSIDQQLQRDPGEQGESRGEGERILFASPLGVSFMVDEEQKVVTILHAWHYRKRHS